MHYDKNSVYLSNLIQFSIKVGAHNKKIGRVIDVSASLKQAYPKVSGIMIKRKKNETLYIPWSNVKKVYIKGKTIFIKDVPLKSNLPKNFSENEIMIKATFLDKQIVDISGSKVVRVNDLHFFIENENLWLIHIDVGIKGLLRRLGWLKFFNGLTQWLLSREIKDKFIPWKYSQPIGTTNIHGALSLKISSASLSEIHPADLADILEDLGYDERLLLFHSLDYPTSAKTLQELPLSMRTQIAEEIPPGRFANIINEMAIDEVVDLLDKLPQEKIEQLYMSLPMEKVVEIEELLSQSGSGAGSLMNTEFIAVNKKFTVKKVLNLIKKEYSKAESIYYIYVVDDNQILIGVVTLRDLLMSGPETAVFDIMRESIVKIDIHEKVRRIAKIFFKYNFNVVPVVDKHGVIKGIISMKDALEQVFPEMRDDS